MKLVHWPSRALLAVPNVTAHPLTASVPITVLLYNGPLLCGFNVPVKGLTAGECLGGKSVSGICQFERKMSIRSLARLQITEL